MAYRNTQQDTSFYLLKPEAYLLNKEKYIKRQVIVSGLDVVEHHRIKVSFFDLMALYPDFMARLTMTLRLPFLMPLDFYLVRGANAVHRLNKLKYRIREDLLGSKLGGFLHTPDSQQELIKHLNILLK